MCSSLEANSHLFCVEAGVINERTNQPGRKINSFFSRLETDEVIGLRNNVRDFQLRAMHRLRWIFLLMLHVLYRSCFSLAFLPCVFLRLSGFPPLRPILHDDQQPAAREQEHQGQRRVSPAFTHSVAHG